MVPQYCAFTRLHVQAVDMPVYVPGSVRLWGFNSFVCVHVCVCVCVTQGDHDCHYGVSNPTTAQAGHKGLQAACGHAREWCLRL